MANLKPGDRVDVRVRECSIVGPYMDCDEIKTLEIVAKDHLGYYLYVPSYYHIKGKVIADQYQSKKLGINKKFVGEYIVYAQESVIYKVNYILDGQTCAKCAEFCRMASPNQEDGTMICWACRANPYWG